MKIEINCNTNFPYAGLYDVPEHKARKFLETVKKEWQELPEVKTWCSWSLNYTTKEERRGYWPYDFQDERKLRKKHDLPKSNNRIDKPFQPILSITIL